MSYRRDVRCSNCYQEGHNVRTCPHIIKDHQHVIDMAKKYGVENPYDHPDYQGARYVGTYWIVEELNFAIERYNRENGILDGGDLIDYAQRRNWEEHEERLRSNLAKKGRIRRCGFCGEPGHNARSCKEKKAHRQKCDALRSLAHRVVAAGLEEDGLVPGALIAIQRYDWDQRAYVDRLAVITDIDWDAIAQPDYDNRDGAPDYVNIWFGKNMIKYQYCDDSSEWGYSPFPHGSSTRPNPAASCNSSYKIVSLIPGAAAPRNKANGYMGDDLMMLSGDDMVPLGLDVFCGSANDNKPFPQASSEFKSKVAELLHEVNAQLIQS